MSMRRFLTIALFFLFASMPAGIVLAAAGGGTDTGVTLMNPLGTKSISVLLTDILQFVVYIGAIVVIFMLIYVGYMFVVARGVPGEITKAKEALKWTVVGALILLGAQAIASGIQATVAALTV